MDKGKPVTLHEIRSALSVYQKEYRKLVEPELRLSQLYDLRTKAEDEGKGMPCWPMGYPNGGDAGVYLVLNENEEVMYIGKASWNSSIGARLGSYFQYDDDKGYKVLHSWSSQPAYVTSLSVSQAATFEAAAIEEYLIKEFSWRLPDNKVGRAGS